jgi:hypothetical protein
VKQAALMLFAFPLRMHHQSLQRFHGDAHLYHRPAARSINICFKPPDFHVFLMYNGTSLSRN